MKRCIHTYDDIISIENLLDAWCEFRQGKKHKHDVEEYGRNIMQNLIRLHEDLKNKTYIHGSYQHFVISDPKRRDIHKASVRDRVVHHAIYRILYPFFDRTFISDSYSCRVNKGTHKAVKQFEVFTRRVSKNYTKQCWVLKCDIRKFFASIDHSILFGILEKRIEDEDILWLLRSVIESFSTKSVILAYAGIQCLGTDLDSRLHGNDNANTMRRVGLPLGNLTSQLLVNIYMNEFDKHVKHTLRAKYYIRYADDFVFVSTNRNELDKWCQKSEAFLTHNLKLLLHPDKVSISTICSGVDFLGWVHFPYHRVLRTVTKRRMLRNVNDKNITSYIGLLSHGGGWKLSQKVAMKLI